MPKLNFLITSDKAYIENRDKKLNIAGVFSSIHSTSLPMVHPSFYVVANISDDNEGPHSVRLVLKKGDDEIKSLSRDDVIGKEFQWIVEFKNQEFQSEGIYEIVIYLNGVPLGSREIRVKREYDR